MAVLCLTAKSFMAPSNNAGITDPIAPQPEATQSEKTVEPEISPFEEAVEIIKKYEGLHSPKHWPLVGYGHKVLPGEKYSRTRALSQAEAEALLRKDLLKNCAVFREFGADSLLLGVLAYNIGSGATLRSSVVKKLRAGDRDIESAYLAHSRYRGKVHNQIRKRRVEEFEALYIRTTETREVDVNANILANAHATKRVFSDNIPSVQSL